MIRTALACAALTLAAAPTITTSANAFTLPANTSDRLVKIINETTYDIVHFFGSHVDEGSWQEDILGVDILYAGQELTIDFDDGTGYCLFDFMAVFSDGDKVVSNRINVCQVGDYIYTEDVSVEQPQDARNPSAGFIARFHLEEVGLRSPNMTTIREYAPYNNMLVRIQNPSCSFYATEKDWRKRFGRHIQEDAWPMLILAPMHPLLTVYPLLLQRPRGTGDHI